MDADPITVLREEVAVWAAEMDALFRACRLLIAHHGTDDELASWDTAVAVPLRWVAAVVSETPPRDPAGAFPAFGPDGAFECSEATASVMAPLIEIVGGPVAHFVYTIRRTIPTTEHGAFTRAYGGFVSAFADAVSYPMWKAYRHLASDEWRAQFPGP